jgi:hypothetical protein
MVLRGDVPYESVTRQELADDLDSLRASLLRSPSRPDGGGEPNAIVDFANWKRVVEYVESQGYVVARAQTYTATDCATPDGHGGDEEHETLEREKEQIRASRAEHALRATPEGQEGVSEPNADVVDAALAAQRAGYERLCLVCLSGFNGDSCPTCALPEPTQEPVARFFRLIRLHSHEVPAKRLEEHRVPAGTRLVGRLYIAPDGELVVTDGYPSDEVADDHPDVHNCDEMGCSTVSHVIARLAAPVGQEPK